MCSLPAEHANTAQCRTWMPRYVSPITSSLRVVNLVPLYMNVPQVLHRTLMGNIMRTRMSFVSARFLLGSLAGSKSATNRLRNSGLLGLAYGAKMPKLPATGLHLHATGPQAP
jgi:hypothetical protein